MQAAAAIAAASIMGTLMFRSSPAPKVTTTEYEGIGHNHAMLVLVERLNSFREYNPELFDSTVDQIDALVFRWHSITVLNLECDKHDGPDAYMILVKLREQLVKFIQSVSPNLKPRCAVELQNIYDDISDSNLQLFLQIMKKCRNIDL